MEKENGNTVLLTVIGVATLLVALVGATFAYFSAQITVNSKESIILTTRQVTGLVYAIDGEALVLPNAVPGNSKTGTFTVTNNDDYVTQSYDVELIVNAVPDTEDSENNVIHNYFTVTDEALLTEYLGAAPTADQIKQGSEQLMVTISGTSDKAGRTITMAADSTGFTANSDRTVGTVNLTDGVGMEGSHKLVERQEIAPHEKHTYTVTVEFKDYDFKQDNNQGKTLDAEINITNPRSVSSTNAGEGA